jgi:DNA-binding transcriptional LysR family regulator
VPQEPIDEALTTLGVKRTAAAIVGGFTTAVALARTSELVASVPERHTSGSRDGMFSFALPYPVKDFVISAMWHPRLEADLAHRWLRECIRRLCQIG